MRSLFKCSPRLLSAAADGPLQRTALFDFHKEVGGRIVPFAGWEMPVQYEGMTKEHFQCRNAAGLFDVSHMCRVTFSGADRERFLEWVTPGDVQALKPGRGRLSLLMMEHGGIKDDLMIFRGENECNVILNAGCAPTDLKYLDEKRQQFKGDVKITPRRELSLLALQGPKAAEVLSQWVPNLEQMAFMSYIDTTIDGMKVVVTRCGYTGEDGFEVAIANENAVKLARLFLSNSNVRPTGLGARDTLRLEAGLCLYGHELSESIDPVSADLMWTITKRRREKADFIGGKVVMEKFNNKDKLAPRVRTGVVSPKGPCPREQTEVRAAGSNETIGIVTSGSPSPCLNKNIGQLYVDRKHAAPGTKVDLIVKNKVVQGEIVALPFVPTRFYRGVK
jgi:aminomethyltransferase